MNQEKVGEKIKEIRKKNNYTQQELANILGVTYQAVSKWENGKNIPDITILQIISNKFNIDIEELLMGKKKKNYKYLFIVFGILILGIFTLILLNKNNNYEFQNLISGNDNFEVNGVIAFSDKKTSLFISEIKTNINDNIEYKVLECTLFEENGKSHTVISKCGDLNKNPICESLSFSELLKTISFNVKNFTRSCKNFKNNSLYLEINALNDDNDNIVYNVPLMLEKNCD